MAIKKIIKTSSKNSGVDHRGSTTSSVHQSQRIECSTKKNTYIYNEINTGSTGTFRGVLLAVLLKTTVIPHLKQYNSLGCCESRAYSMWDFFFFSAVTKQLGMENKVFYLHDYLASFSFLFMLIYSMWVYSFVMNFSRDA